MKRDQYLLGGLFRFSDSLASFLGLLKNEHVLARFLLNFKIKVLKTLSRTSSLIFIALLYVLLIILQHHGWYGIILSIYNNNASTNIRSLLDFFVVLKEITLRSCPPAVDGLGFVFFRPAASVVFDLSSFLKLYYTIQTIQRFVRFSVWKSPCLCKRATTWSLSNWMFFLP